MKTMCIGRVLLSTAVAVIATAPGVVTASVVVVPGTSNPWLSGQPDGTTASLFDVSPAQSPVLHPGVIIPGLAYSFAAVGIVANGPAQPAYGPEGGPNTGHFPGAQNGIANLIAPINSLVGVFVDSGQPVDPAPVGLDFSVLSTGFHELWPLLNQPFFIGGGLTGSGSGDIQQFVAPGGATRLFLGTMDGYEWNNNNGAFIVTVVPEPRQFGFLAGVGVVALAVARRWQNR